MPLPSRAGGVVRKGAPAKKEEGTMVVEERYREAPAGADQDTSGAAAKATTDRVDRLTMARGRRASKRD